MYYRPVVILPTLAREQAHSLIDEVISCRDKAIIALFTKSGLRLQELTNIKLNDIDWDNRTIRVIGKGNKEAHAPFGELSDNVLHTPPIFIFIFLVYH